jgi:hypothetical protein
VSLLLENQISHTVTERMTVRGLLIFAINRMTLTPFPAEWLSESIE